MKRQRISIRVAWVILSVLGIAGPLRADWPTPGGDPAKWVQLPDPNGWDVNFTYPKVLADDFLCTLTGPITDVHFWFSSRQDLPFVISNIHVSFHADIPATPTSYSRPGALLWERDFGPATFTITNWGVGQQGWYDPNIPYYVRPDHFGIWQANIVNIPDPFIQQEGNIYWLDLSVTTLDGQLGWKTSYQHFNDDAVWGDFPFPEWQELRDPITGESLDLAFVLTTVPEPGTLLLVVFGCAGLLAIQRRR
jgi:hypothetical protein